MKEFSPIFPTEPDLISLTEPIKLEPGTLIVVDSKLGWNMEFKFYLVLYRTQV